MPSASKQKGGKHKMLRSGKNARKGTYKIQRERTDRNKIRRAQKRATKRAYWATPEGQARKAGAA